MAFDLIQSISIAGTHARANDDRAGAGAALAWVIDGATDLGPPGLMGSQGGAAWCAATADRAFAGAPAGSLTATVGHVFAELASAFDADRTRDPEARWELPGAAFLAVAVAGEALHLAWLADCACLLIRGDTVERLGPQPTAFETQEARAAIADGLHLEAATRPEATLDRLRRNRARPERRVLGVEPAHAADVRYATAPIRPGDEVVLMTDGMSALVEDYGMPAERFADLLLTEGLHGLAARLRAVEAEDAAGTRYPRFKRSDDATALWLRIR
jgi:serine/threonine protein phosphatase PrpC